MAATEIRLIIQAVPGQELSEDDVTVWLRDLSQLVRMAKTADENMGKDRIATTQIAVLDGMSIKSSINGWF